MSATQKTWSGSVMASKDKQIITVKEARKLLGRDAVDLSDASVMGIIKSLTKISLNLLDNTRVPNNEMV
ncbi:MAG: hypothetical protein EOM45_04335 [Clostridia bacterium]|nr:hypothetical protein [Clostridia bacterium]